MINELLSRPNIQEFLNKYPSSRWKELITDLFEIGVLNLRNSYHRDEYSKKEFKSLIYDLEHPYQNPNHNPPIQQYNQPPNSNSNLSYKSNPYYAKENFDNYNYYNNNYNYERRMNRLEKLEKHASTSQMDAFYSEKNELPRKEIPYNKRRSHQEIMDKINKSQQLRDYQRYQIRDLKLQYLQDRKEALNKKRIEKMIEKKAEEDIKSEENEQRRIKQEQDYQEGYGEDYQEEDENEEEEGIDKYNDYNRGYDDNEEGENEGEEYEEQQGEEYEEQQNYEEYGEEEQMDENNMQIPEN